MSEITYTRYIKSQLVRAYLICGPAEYAVSWGEGVQSFDKPHLHLETPRPDSDEPEIYGCALDVFLATYANAETVGTYRKTTITRARVAAEALQLQTERDGERTHVAVSPGDYLVQENDGNGEYHVNKAQFEAMYIPAPSEA